MPQPRREKTAKTKPVPLDKAPEFTEWTKKARKPTPDDKGEAPPEPPQELDQPLEPGTADPEDAAP